MKNQNTKNIIEQSFIKLLNEKTFDKITVKDIVEECGLTRNTFYYYYEDIYQIVDDIFVREAENVLEAIHSDASWEEIMITVTRFARNNKRLVNHIFRSPKRDELSKYVSKTVEVVISAYVDRQSDGINISKEDLRLIKTFYVGAYEGLTVRWLEEGMKNDLEKDIRRIAVLMRDNIRLMAQRSIEN